LSVIAVGVLLIAYGLLGTRAAAAPGMIQTAPGLIQYDARGQAYQVRPVYPGDQIEVTNPYPPNSYSPYPMPAPTAYPSSSVRPVPVAYNPYVGSAPEPAPAVSAVPAVRHVATPAPRATATRVVEAAPGRDWKKTAMVIGGTTAAGAGLGAVFGGKKGALIGAAIGGGAGTLYEVQKK
jgi:hypothetical protein